VRIKRRLFLLHRVLGIAIGVMFVLWFLSGLVMMYVQFPELTPVERFAGLTPIKIDRELMTPARAARSAGITQPPTRARLTMVLGRPAYHFLTAEGRWSTVFADDGTGLESLTKDEALASAKEFSRGTSASYLGRLHLDQWTVSSTLEPFRPLHRVIIHDIHGTELYISDRTGEVVRDTTTAERAWNWLGANLHWVYPVQLRQYREIWRQVIIWLGGAGTLLAITGVSAGILRHRFGPACTNKSRVTPYRGVLKWHHLSGLVFGPIVITWVFSGWLSVNPGGLFPDDSPAIKDTAIMASGEFDLSRFKIPLRKALQIAYRHLLPKEIELIQFAGRPYYVFYATYDESAILPGGQSELAAFTQFDVQALVAQAAALMPKHAIKEARLLSEYDLYYYGHHQRRRLPVVRVAFDNEARTWYYIDPHNGTIIQKLDSANRAYRWLFNALHRWDFPLLIEHRPAWDFILIALCLGGLTVSATGTVVACRRLRRDWIG
jgi:uncharacterized iron-regulated membrane protein